MNGSPLVLEQNYTGYGDAGSMESMELLQKALTAGDGVDAAAFTGGRALTPESLDNTLVNILHTQDEARLFQRLKKQPISSTVHQWDERTEVGADDGAWVPEGGDSEEADQTIARKFMTAKYLQTLRKTTVQASITRMIENAMTIEQNAGTLWVIRNVERGLFYGNSDYVTEQPDGLVKQIPATNVIDVRGASADSVTFENAMTEAARVIRDNYGKGSLILASTMVIEDIQKLIRDRIKFEAKESGLGSTVFDRYPTPFGTLELLDDIFIKEGNVPAASGLTSKRPGAPTQGSDSSPVDGTALFGANDAGDYVYKVVAVNRYGDSVASAENIIAIAAGDNATIPVTEGSPAATAHKVYRSKKGGATGAEVRYAFTVKRTASPMDVIDRNFDLPGCSDVFVLTMDAIYDAIEWFQFLPLMKFDLYPTNAAVYPFLMLLFGALALKKPVQHVRIKNVSPSRLGWF